MTDFGTFWEAYPRKVGKLAAKRAWDKALREDTPDAIINGLETQLSTLRSTDKQFIPHPSTWLNQGRWMDETEPEVAAPFRPYDTWSEKDKRECAETISKWGIEKAIHMFRYTYPQIERLRAEGYLQPREATG